MSAETLAAVADFALKAGIPAALGCLIVWYLLAKLVPRIMDTYERTLASQQTSFQAALTGHASSQKDLHDMIRAEGELNRKHREDEAAQTRLAIGKLADRTDQLARAVHEVHGRVMTDEAPVPEPLSALPPRKRATTS